MFLIQFDACNRSFIGLASVGFVVYYEDNIIYKHYSIINDEVPNSNYAEYKALIKALQFAKKFNITSLLIQGDAKIVIEQIKDNCHTKSECIKPLLKEVKHLTANFKSIDFQHIYRKRNIMADSLANQALYNYVE